MWMLVFCSFNVKYFHPDQASYLVWDPLVAHRVPDRLQVLAWEGLWRGCQNVPLGWCEVLNILLEVRIKLFRLLKVTLHHLSRVFIDYIDRRWLFIFLIYWLSRVIYPISQCLFKLVNVHIDGELLHIAAIIGIHVWLAIATTKLLLFSTIIIVTISMSIFWRWASACLIWILIFDQLKVILQLVRLFLLQSSVLVFVFPQIIYVYGRIEGDKTLICVTSFGKFCWTIKIVCSSIDHLFFQVVLGGSKLFHRCKIQNFDHYS